MVEAKKGIFAGKVTLQPSFANARSGLFAPAQPVLSTAEAKPGTFAPATTQPSIAQGKTGVFAPAA